MTGLKDHQIAKLTNDLKSTLLIKLHPLRFPQSLRAIISESVNESLGDMNLRIDHDEDKK